MNEECELCELEKVTRWYYEDDVIVILECKTCHVPMGVLRRHSMEPTQEEQNHLESKLLELFPNKQLDKVQRKITDHLHFHMRMKEE